MFSNSMRLVVGIKLTNSPLPAAKGQVHDQEFGLSVSISGKYAIVGAYDENGSAYIFSETRPALGSKSIG